MDWQAKRCVVIGATGGIGSSFAHHLEQQPATEQLWRLGRRVSPSQTGDDQHQSLILDYDRSDTITRAAESIGKTGLLDLVIVATGLLHDKNGMAPEKSLRDLDSDRLARNFNVNVIGPSLVMKAFLPFMRKDAKSVFALLSARVGSISDNQLGGWYGYRSAKAALNQMIRTASIEHQRRWPHAIIVGLHPGTVDTPLSKPFQRNVAEGKLFTAEDSAARMLRVIDKLETKDSGQVFAYDGSLIPA